MLAMSIRSTLVLVRHALPLVSGDIAPRDWPLSSLGLRDAEGLASQLDLPPGTPVVSSDELKAQQTAEAFTSEIVLDPRLREARRPWVDGDYESVAHRWLEGKHLDGWESCSDVRRRMREAATEAGSRFGSGACLVSHGLAISVLVADLADVDPVEFWSELQFPDFVQIDLRSSVASIERGSAE